jgi:hypothetical protein
MIKAGLKQIISRLNFLRRWFKHFFFNRKVIQFQFEISRQGKDKRIIAFVMTNAGQQQFFEDFYVKANEGARNYYFFLVNEYPLDDKDKAPCFKGLVSLTTVEYEHLRGVDIALHAEIWCRSKWAREICYVGHGFPGKHTRWDTENLKSFRHYFLYGPRDLDILALITKDSPDDVSHIKFWKVGYPKYDSQLNDRGADAERLQRELGLRTGAGRLIVLFAPAWDPGGALRTMGQDILKRFAQMPAFDFVIKLHPASLASPASKDYEIYTGGVDWAQLVGAASKEHGNIHFYREHKINPLFKLADILVTDFSGVAMGFFLEDKPVICIDCPEYFEKVLPSWGQDGEASRSNNLFNNGRNASYVVDNLDALEGALIHAGQNPGEFSSERKAIATALLYNPGRGAEATLEAVDKILGF